MAQFNFKSIEQARQKLQSEIDRMRDEIREAREERRWLKDSLLPREVVLDRLNAEVDKAASDFDPSKLMALAYPQAADFTLFKPTGKISDAVAVGAGGEGDRSMVIGSTRTDIGPLLAWLFAPLLKERIAETFGELDYQPGPAIEERPALIADAEKRLHDLEVEEEALIVQSEEAGIPIDRREDADPAVVLEYQETPDAPKEDDGSSEVKGFYGPRGMNLIGFKWGG